MKKQRVVIFESNNGSDYHRCILPSKYLQNSVVKVGNEEVELDFVSIRLDIENKVIREEMLQDGDIVWFNWLVSNNAVDFGTWKVSKNIKFLYSIDDYWYYSEGHPYLHRMEGMKTRVFKFLAEADIVLVSTERLGQHVLPFNSFVSYNPNFLPINEQQFTSNKMKRDKLRVGLFGSSSHLPDYKLLKGAINKISKNKELCEKIEFHICGYTETFLEIKQMFEKKKNLSLVLHAPVEVSEYMKLYNNIDVTLLPLENIEYNRCKSSLKLAECLASNTIPIGSKLYDEKELKGYCVAETPLEYENWLSYLCNRENFDKTLDYLRETNSKDNNFTGRIDSLKSVFETLLNNNFAIVLNDVEVHGITYADHQITEYTQYDNSSIKSVEDKSYLFEYNPILNLSENFVDSKYYGVFSYKFPQKTGVTKQILYKVLKENNYSEYDILGLCPQYFKGNYLQFTEQYHPGFMELFTLVCNDLNLVVKEPKNVIYSNFFIAKGSVYKEFVNNIVKPAIELMETKYKDLAWKDANYISGLKGEELKQQTGLDFYTFHTFVLERLLSIWLENRTDLKFKQIG